MKQRIVTALALVIVTLTLLWLSFWTHLVLAGIIGAGILCETIRMYKKKHTPLAITLFSLFLVSLGYLYTLSPKVLLVQNTPPFAVFLYALTVCIVLIEFNQKKPLFVNSTVLFITRSLIISMSTSLSFLAIVTTSKSILLFFLVLIWTCDISALFVGRAIGKHKLSSTSPNKTIEGALAGILIPMGLSASLLFTSFAHLAPVKIVLACVVAITAQFSDLHESVLKRFFNIKDSSNILPGHGGIYDRCDSYVLSLPTLALLLPHTLIPLLPA